ncbi:DUF421 domain-containing protein [Cupriavidus sp. 30B13]|uniref:DUF421 domain-containing protein n=1 Tax=Cupriavidus sp. 30B13 TaxID=3384241 RepID=UPI003B8EF042
MHADLQALLKGLLDTNEHLLWWQAAVRAAVVFLAAWALLRIAGRRSFAQKTSFDLCIMLLLGAVLSRAVVGATSMAAALASSLVLVLLHRMIGWISVRHAGFDRVVGGRPIELLRDGRLDPEAVRRALISQEDLATNIRGSLHSESTDDIARIVVERDGTVSFVRKDKPGAQP